MNEWLIIIDTLDDNNQEILENQERIFGMLDNLQKRVSLLESKFDENFLIGARSGLHHLLDGLNSDVKAVRFDEFFMAHQEFSRLINMDPEGTTKGTSGEIDNKYLMAIGFWGNFHYFNLRSDKKNALINAYDCTRRYPDIGLILFPARIFSKDYALSIKLVADNLYEIERNIERNIEHIHHAQRSYYKEWAKKIATGVVAAAGLSTAVLFGMNPVSISAAYGGAKAFEKIHPLKPISTDIHSLKEEAERLTKSMAQILCHATNESEKRIEQLQKHTLESLLKAK